MDEKERHRADPLEEIDFFAEAELTPEEKRQINLGLALIGRRMCEECDEEDDLDQFPSFVSSKTGSTHYRYRCRKCYNAKRVKEMKHQYDTDPVYRQKKIEAAQDYRDSLKNKAHYNREGAKRSRASRKRRGVKW